MPFDQKCPKFGIRLAEIHFGFGSAALLDKYKARSRPVDRWHDERQDLTIKEQLEREATSF